MSYSRNRKVLLFAMMAAALVAVGLMQSWSLSLAIINLCIISAIMSLGVNMQWGYAGLFNAGVMGFAALGGLAAILVSMPPITETWAVGGAGIGMTVAVVIATIVLCTFAYRRIGSNSLARISQWEPLRSWVISPHALFIYPQQAR